MTYQRKVGSLMASGYSKLGTQEACNGMYVTQERNNDMEDNNTMTAFVRRLTPTECERLQGFPDGWTDIGEWTDTKAKTHKTADSNRYKALGNSIGIPAWMHIIKGISEQYKGTDHVPTMGSLFDGIGGFPRIWEHYNGKGTALWASEIEEFCIAVTKIHFPEDGEN